MLTYSKDTETHHPHHDVREDGDPQRREKEGQHEEALPPGFGTIGYGEEQQHQNGPGNEKLHFIHSAPYSHMAQHDSNQASKKNYLYGIQLTIHPILAHSSDKSRAHKKTHERCPCSA